jgi:hypothetical protein
MWKWLMTQSMRHHLLLSTIRHLRRHLLQCLVALSAAQFLAVYSAEH